MVTDEAQQEPKDVEVDLDDMDIEEDAGTRIEAAGATHGLIEHPQPVVAVFELS